ncbi:nuclear RNA export factor 1 [Drosophila rhopaloa]|uniref:Nuclear RNA export factor 1 n=1 Tax=Drosophila rhopaloa TaxID=1041015 RepID=A0A6P4FQ88_DRORH|nr:nuclear RNA export factor 1 [Drosophila rhopaloa]
MFCSRRRSSCEGPLCHSTPRSDKYRPQLEPTPSSAANLPVSVYGWYRVLVFSSDRRQSINRVLRRLRRILWPLKLAPRYKHSGGEHDVAEDSGALFTFYVDRYDTASALFRLRRLDDRVRLRVSDRVPQVRISPSYRRRLRRVLLARYDPNQRSLDLTLFHNDEAWRGEFCALAQPHCLSTVIGIMEREMPELVRLTLDRNHLTQLWSFTGVERRFPRLQCVSLRNNDIGSLGLLRVFQFLALVELNLERNLLPAGYEREVLSTWPSLEVLNEIQVTPDPRTLYLAERMAQLTGASPVYCRKFLMQNNGDDQAVRNFFRMYRRVCNVS